MVRDSVSRFLSVAALATAKAASTKKRKTQHLESNLMTKQSRRSSKSFSMTGAEGCHC